MTTDRGAALETATRVLVWLAALAALTFATRLGARGWPPLQWIVVLAFAAGAGLVRLKPIAAWWTALIFLFVGPSLTVAVRGSTYFWDDTIWFAVLLGISLATGGRRWSVPSPWRWPLVYWALAVSVAWPLVLGRETEWSPALLDVVHIGLSGLGGPPSIVGGWLTVVALTHLTGILVVDAICREFRDGDEARFVKWVAWPMGISIVLSSLIAIYQGVVDITFLSGHQWPSIGRAAGGLADGNPYGALAGVWVGGCLALSFGASSRAARLLWALAAMVCWGGLWMTASRMALVAGVVSTAVAAIGLARHAGLRRLSWRAWAGALASGLLLAVAAAMLARQASTMNPWERLLDFLPAFTSDGLRHFAETQLWNRNGPFGSAAVAAVREHPWAGIGVGSWQHLFPDLAYRLTGNRFFFDNAQSWPRHQLAEFGLLGSLGWLVFVALLLRLLATGRNSERPASGVALKGAISAFVVVSLFSMPSQNTAAALGFWLLAAWAMVSLGPISSGPSRPMSRAAGLAALLLVAAFGAVTLADARGSLRPPFRALAADWNFQYGLYAVEAPPNEAPFRWTGPHAVDVFPVPEAFRDGWVRVSVRSGPPDLDRRPMRVTIRRGHSVVWDDPAYVGRERTVYVPVGGDAFVMIEITMERGWRPDQFGPSADHRWLGIRVDAWEFVSVLPPGATAAPPPRNPSN